MQWNMDAFYATIIAEMKGNCNISVIKRRTVYKKAARVSMSSIPYGPVILFLNKHWLRARCWWKHAHYDQKNTNPWGFLSRTCLFRHETTETDIVIHDFVCLNEIFWICTFSLINWSAGASFSTMLVWIMANSGKFFWMNRQYLTETPLM